MLILIYLLIHVNCDFTESTCNHTKLLECKPQKETSTIYIAIMSLKFGMSGMNSI